MFTLWETTNAARSLVAKLGATKPERDALEFALIVLARRRVRKMREMGVPRPSKTSAVRMVAIALPSKELAAVKFAWAASISLERATHLIALVAAEASQEMASDGHEALTWSPVPQ